MEPGLDCQARRNDDFSIGLPQAGRPWADRKRVNCGAGFTREDVDGNLKGARA